MDAEIKLWVWSCLDKQKNRAFWKDHLLRILTCNQGRRNKKDYSQLLEVFSEGDVPTVAKDFAKAFNHIFEDGIYRGLIHEITSAVESWKA